MVNTREFWVKVWEMAKPHKEIFILYRDIERVSIILDPRTDLKQVMAWANGTDFCYQAPCPVEEATLVAEELMAKVAFHRKT